ncbi:hypothetical protein [Rubritalea tangerina]|uniref:ABC3 transporter permease protein domain-containing protein n=1 Tax=Rubritalea tangerina TaxID=430798 RepID=A0ABW4Z8L1_9BACT
MKSWILISSYLWKDTWKRWFEQPGSVLARSLVTCIMVFLSVVFLVAMLVQVERLSMEVKEFGLDNLLVVETVSPDDLRRQAVEGRFRELKNWGELLTVKKLLSSARSGTGDRYGVVSYDDYDMVGLVQYLRYGYPIFILSSSLPEGLLVDLEFEGESVRGVVLKPDDVAAQLLQGNTLFLPSEQVQAVEDKGYSKVYYLQRASGAPSISQLTQAIRQQVKRDGYGKVEVRSAAAIKEKLDRLQKQQGAMRLGMAFALGGAVALIYGTLSVLEFRQSVYVSALMRSFGVSRVFLGMRTLFENILIVNIVAVGVVYALSVGYEGLFKVLRINLGKGMDPSGYFWGQETLWVIVAANVGVLISCIPVFWAMRKEVGDVLD